MFQYLCLICQFCDILIGWSKAHSFPVVTKKNWMIIPSVNYNKTIEFKFAGIAMFWAPLRLILTRAANQGLKALWEGPKTYLCPRTNSLTITVTLEGIAKIKTEKNLQQNSLNNHSSVDKLNGFCFHSMKVHNTSSLYFSPPNSPV